MGLIVNKRKQPFELLREDNQKARVELAVLTEPIAYFPSKEYTVKIAMTSIAFLTAVVVFADKIKAMFH